MEKRKYLVVIPDGLADYPIPECNNRTIMEIAHTPNLDWLTSLGKMGIVQTVPESFSPGSDIANMSIMGYDPQKYYSGRASIEALSLGIHMKPNQLAFRMNLVQIENNIMKDYSGNHITTEQAKPYIRLLQNKLQNNYYSFHLGTSYRHIFLLTTNESNVSIEGIKTTPPHDISGKEVFPYLPDGKYNRQLHEVMNKTADLFSEYKDKLPGTVTQGWLWGEGVTPRFDSFFKKTGMKGGIVTAVDLLKGIAVAADMKILEVPGITGFIDTNYRGKIESALEALNNDLGYVYLHVEAPDESGHLGNIQYKKQSLEDMDRYIFSKIRQEIESGNFFNILILPDHYTPIQTKTHASDPVPFLMIKKDCKKSFGLGRFTEKNAQKSDIYYANCSDLLEEFYT